jgi:hypothetical protein
MGTANIQHQMRTAKAKTRVSRITVGRLYNLGNYEHVRYDVTVEVPEGESATKAMVGIERIIKALAPEKTASVKTHGDIIRERAHVDRMRAALKLDGPDKFRQRHGLFEGTPQEYIKRCYQSYVANRKKRVAWDRRAERARAKLDAIGGAAYWKDAKLDWESDENDY